MIASDGFNSTVAESEPFGVDPHDPTVSLTAPPQLTSGWQAILRGSGYDADDGAFPEESLVWASSLDGALGTGSTVATTPLSPGHHTITLRVVDADGHPATASTSVDVPTRH